MYLSVWFDFDIFSFGDMVVTSFNQNSVIGLEAAVATLSKENH
jgi:hypothetical protein